MEKGIRHTKEFRLNQWRRFMIPLVLSSPVYNSNDWRGLEKIPETSNNIKDQATVFIAKWSLPAIVTMVCIMVFSALYIDGDSIGIISAMITAVVGGLIVVLQSMTGADKDDPISVIAKELIDNLKNCEERNSLVSQRLIENMKNSEQRNSQVAQELIEYIQRPTSTELNIDDKSVHLVDGNTKATVNSNASTRRNK